MCSRSCAHALALAPFALSLLTLCFPLVLPLAWHLLFFSIQSCSSLVLAFPLDLALTNAMSPLLPLLSLCGARPARESCQIDGTLTPVTLSSAPQHAVSMFWFRKNTVLSYVLILVYYTQHTVTHAHTCMHTHVHATSVPYLHACIHTKYTDACINRTFAYIYLPRALLTLDS